MKINKLTLIDSLLAASSEHSDTVSKLYQTLDSDVLLRPAPDGGWSIAQCMDHLNGYGDYYLPLLEKAVAQALRSDGELFKSGWLGDFFTRMMAPETGKKKYKAMKGHIPPLDLDAAAVLAKFLDQQTKIQNLLWRCRQLDLNSVKIPISISRFVRLNIGDTLRFMIAHNCRHMLQAERNLQHQLSQAA